MPFHHPKSDKLLITSVGMHPGASADDANMNHVGASADDANMNHGWRFGCTMVHPYKQLIFNQ